MLILGTHRALQRLDALLAARPRRASRVELRLHLCQREPRGLTRGTPRLRLGRVLGDRRFELSHAAEAPPEFLARSCLIRRRLAKHVQHRPPLHPELGQLRLMRAACELGLRTCRALVA